MVKIQKRSKIIIICAVILIAGGVSTALYIKHSSPPNNVTPDGVNLNPPTKEDLDRAKANKERLVKAQENENSSSQQTTPAGVKKNVTPIITYAGRYGSTIQVGGYVNLFEDGGTCTAVFTNGSNKITRSVQAVKDASSVDCPEISVEISAFNPKGAYSTVLSYSSATAQGSSEARQIQVQ